MTKRLIIATLLALVIGLGLGLSSTHAAPSPEREDPGYLPGCGFRDHVIMWSEDRGTGHRIMARRIQANGLPRGGPAVGTYELTGATEPNGQKGEQRWPAGAPEIVVWSERPSDGGDYDLWAQRVHSSGQTIGAPFRLMARPGDQMHPAIVWTGRDYLMVWSENIHDKGDIMGIRINRALRVRGQPFAVAKGPGSAEDPTLVADPNNERRADDRYHDQLRRYLVLWTDDRNGSQDIYGARIASTGLPMNGPQRGHFPLVDGPEDDHGPTVMVVGHERGHYSNGRRSLVLLWSRDTLTDGADIMAKRLHVNGLPHGSSYLLAGGPGNQTAPLLMPERQYEWLAMWVDDTYGTTEIRGIEVLTNGLTRREARTLVGEAR